MSDVAIKLVRVSKYYKLYNASSDRMKEALNPFGKCYHKEFYALKDINLEVKKGEILGIVGKNGCGKSTLLKLIAGVLVPNAGEVAVNGKISALLELGSGFNPEFTGLQNIFFYGTILGFRKVEMEEKLDDILKFADIGDFIHQPIKSYSSGMKSRLSFAVAVHIDPEILILDEVLSVGDAFFRRKCFAKMEEFFDAGKTILYVSHDENSINRLCSRAILLDKGEIILSSSSSTVTKLYQKFIFSKQENKGLVRSEIDKYNNSPSSFEDNFEDDELTSSASSYYLPDFTTESMVQINNYAATLSDFVITDEGEKKKNILKFKEKYIYMFTVTFDEDVEEVAFGSQIKSINGMTISMASTNTDVHRTDLLRKGVYQVLWTFNCLLMPGVYYIDSSVSANMNGKRELLSRAKDCIVFKVMPEKNSLYQGIVSLEQEIEILPV